MNCKKARQLILTDFSDGELSEERMHAVRLHIEACSGCQTIYKDVSMLTTSFRSLKPLDLPRDLSSVIMHEIDAWKKRKNGSVREKWEVFLERLFPTPFAAGVNALICASIVCIIAFCVMHQAGMVSYSLYEYFPSYGAEHAWYYGF